MSSLTFPVESSSMSWKTQGSRGEFTNLAAFWFSSLISRCWMSCRNLRHHFLGLSTNPNTPFCIAISWDGWSPGSPCFGCCRNNRRSIASPFKKAAVTSPAATVHCWSRRDAVICRMHITAVLDTVGGICPQSSRHDIWITMSCHDESGLRFPFNVR